MWLGNNPSDQITKGHHFEDANNFQRLQPTNLQAHLRRQCYFFEKKNVFSLEF